MARESTPGTKAVNTMCAYCGVGCGMVLQVTTDPKGERRHVAKSIGNKHHPANFGRLCTKGATTADLLAAPGRMESAHARADRGEPLEPIDMDTAIAQCATRLRAIIEQHGPDAFAMYVSGQMSIEAQYLANKLTKGFIGTNQIESNSRLCMAGASSGYKLSLGADGPPGSYQDFEAADVFFVIGANMADCVALVAGRCATVRLRQRRPHGQRRRSRALRNCRRTRQPRPGRGECLRGR